MHTEDPNSRMKGSKEMEMVEILVKYLKNNDQISITCEGRKKR